MSNRASWSSTPLLPSRLISTMLLRGLFEHKVETLQAEIGPHVARTVAFFLAGCRQGGGA